MTSRAKRQLRNQSSDRALASAATKEATSRQQACIELIGEVRRALRDLHVLPNSKRQSSQGKAFNVMELPARLLLEAMIVAEGDGPYERQEKSRMREVFDLSIGRSEDGKTAKVFEAEAIAVQIARINAQQAIIAELDLLRRELADDTLHTASLVVARCTEAMALAKILARSDQGYHRLLADALNSTTEMTKVARSSQAKAAAAEKPAETGAAANVAQAVAPAVIAITTTTSGPSGPSLTSSVPATIATKSTKKGVRGRAPPG